MILLQTTFLIVRAEDLKPHEEFVEDKVPGLVAKLETDGAVTAPIVVDKRTLVILDGHHRFEALKRIGLRYVPVVAVDYFDPAIRVSTWRDGEAVPTKDDVLKRALEGRLYPPKSTKHEAIHGLASVPVKLSALAE